ncbi:MAG: PHP domain-containing protein [Clostridia bacterium]|nr:PHP domain-containing protein [Clostridia bacterium]
MKCCDLHSHSNFSDGSLTPTELVSLAEQTGLSALALTDHNTTKGLEEFLQAGENSKLITVPGCEFSTQHEDKELHIVGLFMPRKSWVEIEDFVELMHMAKHNSNQKLIRNLQQGGIDITFEEVASLTDADEFNRSHVARTLVKHGYASSVQDAFEKFLRPNKGFYVPAKKLSSLATIRFIKANGGVAVWAHPFFSAHEQRIAAFLPLGKEAGLDAIETMYTTYSEEEFQKAKELADANGLLYSGGSDYHGAGKPDIELGSGYGNLAVPFSFYEKLYERSK